ncbi:MAG: tRNA adenosine(34) deaminase TadA [Snowella sp.]|nr:tRNA adenosine(34) deaminase TadA [Snowella sp.]
MRFDLFQLDAIAYQKHCYWMERALRLAAEAGEAGEIPVGAVIVDRHNQLVAEASNRKERDSNPTAHAELLAIQTASQQLHNWHLDDLTLYVTLEPCPMCTGAIIHARLGLLVYGANDPKTGSVRTVLNLPDSPASNHRLPVISGILERRCREQLQNWFSQKRHQSR